MLIKSPFHQQQAKCNGKFVDYLGWELPVQYSTITEEHNAVRNAAGLCDVSHMGQVWIEGPDAEAALQYLVSNNIQKCPDGKGIYAHLLTEKGTVIDDLFVFRLPEKKFFLIINASRKEVDIKWMKEKSPNFDITIKENPNSAGMALQGPKAISLLGKLSAEAANLPRNGIGIFTLGSSEAIVSRTGYTGEDGVELFGQADNLVKIWDLLCQAGKEVGLLPCGLGARDTLRTEVAYPLYGHELDENHTPFEAGLSWVVKLDKGNFIGRDALLKQKSDGLQTKLFGFKIEKGGVARPGGQIFMDGKEVGPIASGTFSPTLGYAIGLAYLPIQTPAENAKFEIRMGSRQFQAITVKLPFFKKPGKSNT